MVWLSKLNQRTLIVVSWVLIAIFILYSPITFRFETDWLNNLSFILLLFAIPTSMAWVALGLSKKWSYLLGSLAVVISLPVLIIAFFTYLHMLKIQANGEDSSFQKIKELKSENHYIRLYRGDLGATTRTAIAIRKEYPLFLGLKAIQKIKGFDGYDAYFEKPTNEKVKVIVLTNFSNEKKITYEVDL